MFKLIVMLFVVNNGVTAEQPSGQLKASISFETEKACIEFLETDRGKKAFVFIEELIEQQKGNMEAKVFCVQDGVIKPDDSI